MSQIRLTSEPTAPAPAADGGPGDGGPGDWADLRFFRAESEDQRPGDCDIVFSQRTYRAVVEHLSEDTSREHGGLLLGYEVQPSGGGRPTVFVLHSLPARNSSGTPTSLTIPEEDWADWNRITDFYADSGLRLRRVGWYHSHPNISIFLSRWDLDVCTNFSRKTHVALVVDPVRQNGAFFVHGDEGYRPHSPQGFWELCDEQPASVVTWKNVAEVVTTGRAGASGVVPLPAAGPALPARRRRDRWIAFGAAAAALLVAMLVPLRVAADVRAEAREELARALERADTARRHLADTAGRDRADARSRLADAEERLAAGIVALRAESAERRHALAMEGARLEERLVGVECDLGGQSAWTDRVFDLLAEERHQRTLVAGRADELESAVGLLAGRVELASLEATAATEALARRDREAARRVVASAFRGIRRTVGAALGRLRSSGHSQLPASVEPGVQPGVQPEPEPESRRAWTPGRGCFRSW